MERLREYIRLAVREGRSEEIRLLLLNTGQLDLIEMVVEHETLRASLLSHLRGVSIQNASSKLNALYRRGYLDRINTGARSGGTEFCYFIPDDE